MHFIESALTCVGSAFTQPYFVANDEVDFVASSSVLLYSMYQRHQLRLNVTRVTLTVFSTKKKNNTFYT